MSDHDYSYILAVDPGVTTGWVLWDVERAYIVGHGQDEMMPFLERVDPWARASGCETLIVCESFAVTVMTAKKGSVAVTPLRIIGALEWIAHQYGLDMEMSQPAAAMKMIPDSVLHTLGWYPKSEPHARDAMRHLARALVERKLLDARLLVQSK